MTPITENNWKQIHKFWGNLSHATASPNLPYCIFATVDEDGSPRVAPYSSLVLGQNNQGFFFDHFSQHLTKNLDRDRKICILLLNNSRWFWMKAVLFGKFDHAPGIRLTGTVGERRKATDQEINAFKKPLKRLKRFKGYNPLWGVLQSGRNVYFHAFETVKCGPINYVQAI